jgi:hypothetical protein
MIPRQLSMLELINLHEPLQGARILRRKKSEKRQRTERVTVRLLPSEREIVEAHARRMGMSVAALMRLSALGFPYFLDRADKAINEMREET